MAILLVATMSMFWWGGVSTFMVASVDSFAWFRGLSTDAMASTSRSVRAKHAPHAMYFWIQFLLPTASQKWA